MTSEIGRIKLYQLVDLDAPRGQLPAPPQRPYCAASILNWLELGLEGEMLDASGKVGGGRRFVTRSQMRLGVGWEAIEVFTNVNLDNWRPEYAVGWAERDILAGILTAQNREHEWGKLDPKAAARKSYAALLA